MTEVIARPKPVMRPQKPLTHAAPRLGLASIQAVAFEGNGTTNAAWAVVVESPNGEYSTLATGLSAGVKRTTPATNGDEYGRAAKRVGLLDAFETLLKHRQGLEIDTLAIHCPDLEVVENLKAILGTQPSTLIGGGREFTNEFRWGKIWEAYRIAYEAAAALALSETKKSPLLGATDGSLHPFNKGAGAGWVLADGRAGASRVDTTEVLVAELSGIRDLIKGLEEHQAVVIEIDSREALKVARNIISTGAHEATKTLSGIVNALGHEIEDLAKGHHIELKWVRGHSGNKLNELADQLALAASRRNRGLISNEDLNQVINRVKGEAF